jgi:alpha-1,2-mannosyltransferase
VRSRQVHWVVALNIVLAVLGLSLLTSALDSRSLIPAYCEGSVLDDTADFFNGRQGNDSWAPMVAALNQYQSHPDQPLYQAAFFQQKDKFLYPLASLLPIWALKGAGLRASQIYTVLHFLCWISVVVAILCSLAIFFRAANNQEKTASFRRLTDCAFVILLGLTFYPLMKGYSLGQVQAVIDAIFAMAFLSCYAKRERTSGALIGLMCLMKPQYLLIVVWSFLRRRWNFAWVATGVVVLGTALSVFFFGVANHLDYIRVLSLLGSSGQAYYPNQSVNGLLNRLLENGNNTFWAGADLPPYRPVIFYGTLLTSAVMLALAVPWRKKTADRSGIFEFSLIGVVATVCSPIAWEHHYGILLPVFALLFGIHVSGKGVLRAQFPLLVVAYVLIANNFNILNLFSRPPANIVQSYTLYGALVLIILLRRLDKYGNDFHRVAPDHI